MVNQELSEIFQQMAEILEFLDNPSDKFRIRAYQNASLAIQDAPESLEKMAREKKLKAIPGIGEGIAKKIEEYIAFGRIREFELLKKAAPKGFFEMLAIPSLGPKKVKMLYHELHIKSIGDLKKAVKAGRVQALEGFGEKSAQKILEGIEMKSKSKGRRILGAVYLIVSSIVEAMKKCKEVDEVVPAGSFRRNEETVGDIDILATGKHPEKITDYFARQQFVSKVLAQGDTKISILTKDGLQVDLRVVEPKQFGSALQYFTGSKLHNVHLRTFAKNRGFKLSEYGFFKGKKLVASKTEEECYKSLGMQFIPPEMRNDTGEIEAAYRHELPTLIELKNIRGDLHSHSVWSDGRNSIKEMALEGHRRGYEYIALTDHSPSLIVANGLKPDRLKKKKREIDELNEKLPIKILFGTEVDILKDGDIDYPDEILKQFDIVVASIHSRFGQDNTARLLKAMENPHVHIIGHASGRLIGQRNPYALDYDKLFKKASETGTIFEINSQPLRFDLQDQYIREAKRWKCKFSINSDAHSTQGLWVMELGVHWAKRGWVEAKEVVNTLPLGNLKKILK
ncbi:DNA polymerase/3'-5' exonuclease PolX [Candidatus Peregrinibacteria bacterium]|nr:DNA polymerase/3'-5' exonuclease PolX [Candidatus Peregrinibacteria bacterium]